VHRASESSLKALKNLSWLKASQLSKLAKAMSASWASKSSVIFDERSSSDIAYILLSGAVRITCRNRNGRNRSGGRTMIGMLGPGMLPSLPPPVFGINHSFRCEAASDCQLGRIDWDLLLEICLETRSADFKRLAANYIGRWDLMQLRRSNFVICTLAERLALILLELSDNFGVRDADGMRIAVPARHRVLAELAGASRPRVSEHLRELGRKGLIVRKKRQLIVKRDRLESFLRTTAGAAPL
jgi:CRP/FNR family transcriptional regulator, cyclic AMP receptor protein